MTKSKEELIRVYINELEQGLNNLKKSDFYTYGVARDDLVEIIIEVINIFSEYIPEIEQIVLLNNESEYRDVNSLIGKLRLYLILESDKQEKLVEFINYNIEQLEIQLDHLEKSKPEEYDTQEEELFKIIMITVNTFLGNIPGIDEIILLRNGTGIGDVNLIIDKLKLEIGSILDNNNKSLGESFLRYASETLGDTKKGMAGLQIVKCSNQYSWKYGVDIPITSSDFGKFGSKVPNKRTALYLNLCAFNAEQQFEIILELCELEIFNENEEVKDLKISLYENFGKYSKDKLSESELVISTGHWLSNYPESLKQYDSAIEKYERKKYERNILDDMRLSFELLLKDILDNQKNLENQISELGQVLKEKGVSKEIRNLIIKVIDYYIKYQNDNVKHNDKVSGMEIEYVIEQTSILMKFLIKVLNK